LPCFIFLAVDGALWLSFRARIIPGNEKMIQKDYRVAAPLACPVCESPLSFIAMVFGKRYRLHAPCPALPLTAGSCSLYKSGFFVFIVYTADNID
jgi:hypothetical protein